MQPKHEIQEQNHNHIIQITESMENSATIISCRGGPRHRQIHPCERPCRHQILAHKPLTPPDPHMRVAVATECVGKGRRR